MKTNPLGRRKNEGTSIGVWLRFAVVSTYHGARLVLDYVKTGLFQRRP